MKNLLFAGAMLLCTAAAIAQPDSPYTDLGAFSGPQWNFTSGQEFPGASGAFTCATIEQKKAGKLTYDFTQGGLYVGATSVLRIESGFEEIRFRVKSNETQRIMVRLFDTTGQCHQHTLSYADEGEWQLLRIVLKGRAATVFGGAHDGKIHYPVTRLLLAVEKSGTAGRPTSGEICFADLRLLK